MDRRELSLAVVGISHPNANGSNRRFEAMLCVPGESVELRPEPKNKHDSNAVAVFSARGVQIGYLTAAGSFYCLARSNTVTTPPAGTSDSVDE